MVTQHGGGIDCLCYGSAEDGCFDDAGGESAILQLSHFYRLIFVCMANRYMSRRQACLLEPAPCCRRGLDNGCSHEVIGWEEYSLGRPQRTLNVSRRCWCVECMVLHGYMAGHVVMGFGARRILWGNA